jgi:xanthine/CO dehydrogenase XdhC/CoxF family maturation factor
MTPEALQTLRSLVQASDSGETVALATIIRTRGSTPRKEGARMVVSQGGILAGTVGGGCGEGEVLEAAARVLEDGRTRTVQVDLTEDLVSLSPAVCGGIMDVRVERVPGKDE